MLTFLSSRDQSRAAKQQKADAFTDLTHGHARTAKVQIGSSVPVCAELAPLLLELNGLCLHLQRCGGSIFSLGSFSLQALFFFFFFLGAAFIQGEFPALLQEWAII